MKYGICLLSIVPCRKEPNDRSEMVTQLLFGDLVKISTIKGKWLKMTNASDSYEAWIDRLQMHFISEKEYKNLLASDYYLTEDILTPLQSKEDGHIIPVVHGSRLYGVNKDMNHCNVVGSDFEISGHIRKKPTKTSRNAIIEDAFLYLNAPYLWGGKSPLGIDCSGYVQMVYAMNGIDLPRDAYLQAEIGQSLSFIEEAEEGDLAFFDNDDGKIIHVGIMLKDHRIIHASGKVRVDRIDHQGIFRNESNDYSHSLRIIKKIF